MRQISLIFILVTFFAAASGVAQVATPGYLADLVSPDTLMKPVIQRVVADSANAAPAVTYRPFKTKAHASYYSDKFNGRRTASGTKFNNSKYTAAHRTLPFGTKVRLTNEANGKSVIVEITDRGPFSKFREIDITRKAFMEITHNKGAGGLNVTIEEVISAGSPATSIP